MPSLAFLSAFCFAALLLGAALISALASSSRVTRGVQFCPSSRKLRSLAKGILSFSVVLVASGGLLAGPALAQTYLDPSTGGTGGTGSQSDPYLAGEFATALQNTPDGETLIIQNSGTLDDQTGASRYERTGDLIIEGSSEDVSVELDLSFTTSGNLRSHPERLSVRSEATPRRIISSKSKGT